MGQNTEELSTTPADIEHTRSNLSRDIDELSDKVSPQRMMERRKEAAKSRLGSVRDKLMGSASDAKHSAASTGGSVSESADRALGTIGSQAQGNPLAAGAVAFGAGMLLSALLPASDKETRLAQRAVETAQDQGRPMVDEAKSVGKEMGQHLKDSASESADEIRSTAQESAENVKQEGRSSAQAVKDDTTS